MAIAGDFPCYVLVFQAAWNVFRKMLLLLYAILFFCLSWEERGLPAALGRQRITPAEADCVGRRTVIFIRHGQVCSFLSMGGVYVLRRPVCTSSSAASELH